jgi:hypothetical protein
LKFKLGGAVRCILPILNDNYGTMVEVAVMAPNRECEAVLLSGQTYKCAGSSPSPPENLVSTVSRI